MAHPHNPEGEPKYRGEAIDTTSPDRPGQLEKGAKKTTMAELFGLNPVEKPVKDPKAAHELVASHAKAETELTEREERQVDKVLDHEFREDFVKNAEKTAAELAEVKVNVGGEQYVLAFSAYCKDGKPVDEKGLKELKEAVEKGDQSLESISGDFKLKSIEGRSEKLDLKLNVPLIKILTAQPKLTLERYLNEIFGGAEGKAKLSQQQEYQKSQKPESKEAGREQKEAVKPSAQQEDKKSAKSPEAVGGDAADTAKLNNATAEKPSAPSLQQARQIAQAGALATPGKKEAIDTEQPQAE